MTNKKKITQKTGIQRAVRPDERIPVGGHRDTLTVRGLDSDYSYRWVKDVDESGARIFEFIEGGWDFAPAAELRVGQSYVYTSENVGSIIRRPSGEGTYVYLMCIPIDIYESDQKAKQKRIDEEEAQMLRPRDLNMDDGQYGGGTVKRTLG